MKFNISHQFDIPPKKFKTLYFAEDHVRFLDKHLGIRNRTLIKEYEDNGTVTKEYMVEPDRDIPKLLKSVLDPKKINYYEKRVFDKKGGSMDFWMRPVMLSRKIEFFGKCSIMAVGKNRVRRDVSGELTVKIPGIGRALEKVIVKEIVKSFDESCEYSCRYFESVR